MDNVRCDYSPISEREPLQWPDGARVAVWVIPNIEHFHIDKPATALVPITASLTPDILNFSWREYGTRVGIWRIMEIMDKYGVKGTVALNAEACEHYLQIIKAGNQLGWEWMGHGESNSTLFNNLEEEDERQIIKRVISSISEQTKQTPKGWLSPALSETYNTPDLLAEEGIEYTANWVNDDQPYFLNVRHGELVSIPYSVEINDIPAILCQMQSAEAFYQMAVDQFDVLYEEGETTGRVMAISLHPFIVGQPFRAKYLDKMLKHITDRKDVWITTGNEIVKYYKETHKK